MIKKNITLSGNEKISLISNLGTMLGAGISIIEAVDSIMEDAKGNSKKVLESLRADLMQGKPMHEALAQFPQAFDKVTINLIKAAEEAGTLETTLKDLKINIQKDIEFSDKVKFALIYPVFILVIFLGVLLMILVVVVPKVSQVFSRLNVVLPLPTRILVFLSDLILKQTVPLVIFTIVASGGIAFIYSRNKSLFTGIIFSLPLIKTLFQKIDLTRFSRSLYLLLSSGIPITSALGLSEDVVMKTQTRALIIEAREKILSGKRFSEGLKNSKGLIPNIMIKLIEVGEKTGSLDKSMQDISEYLDYEVSNALKAFTAVLEPIMLLIVGVSVGGMMLAIISPIYGLIGQVGPR